MRRVREKIVIEVDRLIVDVYQKYRKWIGTSGEDVVKSMSRAMGKYCDLVKYRVDSNKYKLYFNCKNTLCVWVEFTMQHLFWDFYQVDDLVITSSYYRPECREWSF